jgi:hypothetical protein
VSNHDSCPTVLKDRMALLGIEIHVSTLPPVVSSPWTEWLTCPHGTKFWYEPTTDQRAAWARDGVT